MTISAVVFAEGQSGERRDTARTPVDKTVSLLATHGWPLPARLENLSASGFKLRTEATLAVSALIGIGIPGTPIREARVIHAADGAYGCQFLSPLSDDDLEDALSLEESGLSKFAVAAFTCIAAAMVFAPVAAVVWAGCSALKMLVG
jgi:hypothetical protein